MKKKVINVFNINLAYQDINEDKSPIIFFIHGNSISSASWKAQLESGLLKNYRLIAIDLPAHGDSEGSSDPDGDYSIPALGKIVATAIKSIAKESPYLIAAVSLGTNILAESLAFNLNPEGIILAGSCLVGEKYTMDTFIYPGTNVHVVFTEQSPENDVRTYASQVMTTRDTAVVNEFVTDYYRVKPQFRSALSTSITQQQFNDEIELVASLNKPVLMIFGKDEQVINPDYLDSAPIKLWNNQVYKIPGANHLVHIDQPEAFNQLLADYAGDIFNTPE
uniref:alpha/beta fold hydrolase n=1 Tax=Pedobacter schmidteae TaxID=2201271 RepID=UPI000EB4DF42|nr:alpha/beta hydrolase [Pedobacter schmidteae]